MGEASRRRLRILVADDSAVMRGMMRTLFLRQAESVRGELPLMELCGVARDGVECLDAVRVLRPDVLLLDLEMPRMHGLDVLDRLRQQSPELPVIMCSAYTERGARSTLDALARGAADYVMKPSEQSEFALALQALSEQLLPKVAALASGVQRVTEKPLGGRLKRVPKAEERESRMDEVAAYGAVQTRIEVIVIGVSTGGPSALETMLPMLPAELPVPVLIVQHMPKLFTGALAERLDRCCALRVKEAYEPGDMHMEVGRRAGALGASGRVQVYLHRDAPVNYCRPSVDRLFHSAVKIYGAGTLAVVMTGMGADGLAGARAVHEAGGAVLTQDESSSVVWGMPGRVTQAGIASAMLPLVSLADELTDRLRVGREGVLRRSAMCRGSMPHAGVDGLRRLEGADVLL
jgi:two-component system chemotaxis response regulator CheB